MTKAGKMTPHSCPDEELRHMYESSSLPMVRCASCGGDSGVTQQLPSYHDDIQTKAKEIERERAKIYVVGSGTGANARSDPTAKRPSIVLTEAEKVYLMGAEYKIMRARGFTQKREKALDDLLDAYNYIAMAYNEMKKNAGAGMP